MCVHGWLQVRGMVFPFLIAKKDIQPEEPLWCVHCIGGMASLLLGASCWACPHATHECPVARGQRRSCSLGYRFTTMHQQAQL